MILFRLLTWPYARRHRLRTLLTLAGIVLGVAVFVGMHTANQNVAGAFRQTVDRIAGAAQLQVSAGETGFPEEILEKVQAVPGVRAAAPVIEAVLDTGIAGQGSLLILGVDMTGDRSLRDYDLDGSDEEVIEDPLVFLAQPDSLILSRSYAERNGIQRNAKITLQTSEGPKLFTVRGLMKTSGLASAFGGNLAVMDIYAAQVVFGRGRLFDRIDIGVQDDMDVALCRRAIEASLGRGFQVEPPQARAGHFDLIARGLSTTINITSLFALLIGVFIIYNSFAIAITQRRGEIGILRALGATRRQILWLFIGESAVTGVIGSMLGVLLGLWIARGVAPQLSSMVREMYGQRQVTGDVAVDASVVALAMGIGVAASIVGGILPARAAARVDPVKALQKGRYQVLTAGENRIRRAVAFGLAAGATACLLLGKSNAAFYSGYALVIAALTLLVPALAAWLARGIRPMWKTLRPVEGALAADSLIQSPRRTSATVTALMLSLALAVGFAGISGAIYDSVLRWMDNTLNPDLFVYPTANIMARDFRFPASFGEELRALPEVEDFREVRVARVMVKDIPTLAIAVPIDKFARRVKLLAVEGDPAEMLPLCAAGKGVILSDSMSNIRGIHKGDVLELDTPGGKLSLPVLGTTIDYSDQQGSFLIDMALYRRYWHDDTVNTFGVYLKPGMDPEKAKESILAALGQKRRVFVFTNAALRQYILQLTAQWFALTYVQLAVALLVAILGIVNTLTVSITDRRRELGVLRAVGGLRGQVRRTIWLEALAIGLIGLLLGLAMGAVTLYYNIGMLRRDMAGLRLEYQYPFGFAVLLLPVILGAAFLASLWPAEAAVRGSLVESLEYE